nr:hypothetical protein [Tanacetum cinerariifolium]
MCINCTYGDGKPVTCCKCEGPLKGGFCLSYDSKSENNTSSNFNHLPQPQYETYLCELCGNNSHYGYDCQQQFPFVYKQEPSYYQNYNNNYYPYDSPEYLENSSNTIAASNSNQEKEGPPQDFDIRQLIREECCTKDCREQKQNMENMMIELIEVCRQKEFYCMHNNVDDLIESALNSKLLSINLKSQRLDKEKQEVKNVVEQPNKGGTRITASLQNFRVIKSSISLNNTSQVSPVHAITTVLPTEEPEYSLSMGYEHLSTTPKTESDEVIKSGVEKIVQIPSEYEVTSEDKRECDVPVCKDSSTFDVCKEHSEILSNSNDDDISSDDDAFEDAEYVEASPLDSKLISLEEGNDSSASFPIFEESDNSLSNNSSLEIKTFSDHTEETRSGSTTTHANYSLPEYDSFCFEIEPDQERLASIVMKDIFYDSTNDPLLEEVDLFLASDNSIPPGIGNIDYDSEGDIHFLEELLVDDSIPIPENESSDFDHQDDSSFPRPPPEPPDVEFFFGVEPNSGDVISAVINNIVELNEDECFDPG